MTGALDLPLPLVARGKVRELYAVGDDALLLVASDRLSAYDVVLPTLIPDKGAVLTGLSLWWFGQLRDLVPDHLVTADVSGAASCSGYFGKMLILLPVLWSAPAQQIVVVRTCTLP